MVFFAIAFGRAVQHELEGVGVLQILQLKDVGASHR